MSAERNIALDDARTLCDEVLLALEGTFSRCDYAGSVKREKALVGDLEIIVAASDAGIDQECDALLAAGVLEKRLNKRGHAIAWGERQKAAVYRGLPLDIWIVRPDRYWGVTEVLRTGPKELNRMLVTVRGQKTPDNLPGLCPPDLVWRDGAIWRLPTREAAETYEPKEPLPAGSIRQYTPEAEDVFAVMGLPYMSPEQREPSVYALFEHAYYPPLSVTDREVTIYTSRINLDDEDVLDITIGAVEQRRSSPAGVLLAPYREWVTQYKAGRMSSERYTRLYRDEIAWRYQWHKQGFLNILARGRVVLGCYCGHDAEFCHRWLAKDILLKIATRYGITAYDGGEIVPEHQLELF